MQQGWAELLEKYEGETYGVWNDNTLITGGAFDDELQPIHRKKNLTAQIQSAEGKRESNAPTLEEHQHEM